MSFHEVIRHISEKSVKCQEAGTGKTILFLHSELGIRFDKPFLEGLSDLGRAIAPIHPGFAGTERQPDVSSVQDLARLYCGLLVHESLEDVIVVGSSLGAWIAAEMATSLIGNIGGVVLLGPVGIRPQYREGPEIFDIFAATNAEFARVAFHDPSILLGDGPMTEEAAFDLAYAREAAALYAWSPYMYEPSLHWRLQAIRSRIVCLSGESDRFAAASYAQRFSEMCGSAFATVAGAGHYPHIEAPDAVLQHVEALHREIAHGEVMN